jgi:hypothetical protein
MSEPVKTICLEISRREAFLLIAALQEMEDDTVDEILSTEETVKMKQFDLLLGMIGRIGMTCVEVGLFNSESLYDLRKEIERNDYDDEENNHEKI